MNYFIIALPIIVSIFSIVFSALALYISWDSNREKLFAVIHCACVGKNNPLIKSDSLFVVIDNVGQISVRVIGIMAGGHMLLPILDEESKDNKFGKIISPNGSIVRTIPLQENLKKIKNVNTIYVAGTNNRKYKFNNLKTLKLFIEKTKNGKTS